MKYVGLVSMKAVCARAFQDASLAIVVDVPSEFFSLASSRKAGWTLTPASQNVPCQWPIAANTLTPVFTRSVTSYALYCP